MTDNTTATSGKVVQIHYKLSDDDGTVLDQSSGTPMAYLHGHGNIVPGLENALEGKSAGEQIQVVVEPGEGYGEFIEDAAESVHRNDFPKGMELQAGMPFRAQTSSGEVVVLWIESVKGARVTVTRNHPLAGKRLHFDVTIESVRDASEEEIAHGHAHGDGGHHH